MTISKTMTHLQVVPKLSHTSSRVFITNLITCSLVLIENGTSHTGADLCPIRHGHPLGGAGDSVSPALGEPNKAQPDGSDKKLVP